MTDSTGELRRFGDRLDWVFPPEPEEALVDLIAPLFHGAPESPPAGDQAASDPVAGDIAPAMPLRAG